MQGLGRLTRTENDSHAAGAIRDLLMQAAEVDDANRGFQLENAGGLRCGDLAYAVAEHEIGNKPLPFQGEIRRALDGENQRLRNAGLCEPLSQVVGEHLRLERPSRAVLKMRIGFLEALTECGIGFKGRTAHARPLTAISRKHESDGRVLSDARPTHSGADLICLFRRDAQSLAQCFGVGERDNETFRKLFAAVTGRSCYPLDLVRVRVFNKC